jgi:hypothetical protein
MVVVVVVVVMCMGHKPDNRKKVKKRTVTSSILYCIVLVGLIFFSAVINPNDINNNSGKVITANAQSISNNNNGSNSGAVFSVNGPYSDKAPTFLDAYWTNNPSGNSSTPPITTPNTPPPKTEVGPGDNVATLAVVLVNRGRSDITGVTGYLDLPTDFRPIAGKNNGTSQSVAGYYSVVKAGSTFVLYFDMSVLKQAKVGGYSTSLNIKYTKILEVGELMTRITVPFRLTGKVVLNTVAKNTELIPGMPNDIRIDLQNIGTANATGVVVTVIGVTGSTVTNSATADTTAATTSANSNSSVTGASTGQQQPSSFSSIPAANLGSETFNVGTIPANGTVEINPIVYPTASAGETAQNLGVQISYGDAYGNLKTVNPQVGFIITPNPPQSVLNVTSNNENALILTAGKIQNMSFTLANNDKRPITNVVATLSSQSSSLNILGDTRWTMQTMPAQSKLNLSTKVFASASIVSQPSLFTLTIQYISAGQSKLDSLNLGAYITGEIKIRVYDVSFNKIGNIPNLVGSILNEGNTVGLFTTVEIVKQTSSTPTKRSLTDFITSVPPSQYLGDLDADSPLPFSIPLSIDNKTMARMPPGMYPVTLKITYSDDLKIPHQLILNNMVNFQPARQPGSSEHLNFFGFDIEAIRGGTGNNFLIIAIVAAIAIVALFIIIIIVRRSKARKLRTGQEEIVKEPFLDDFSSSSSSIEGGISDDARKKKKSSI